MASKGYDPHWSHVSNPHGAHPRNSARAPRPPRAPAARHDEIEPDTGPDSELPPAPMPAPYKGS